MKMFHILFLLPLLLLSGCGYRFDGGGEKISVSVPYVQGDHEGELTEALVWALSRSPSFRYTHGEGDWILQVRFLKSANDRIGYRYDRRNDKNGTRRKNIVGIENRKTSTVEVTVLSAATGCRVLGPQVVRAHADYDYVDPNYIGDLAFDNLDGQQETSIAFSLGQLDSVGAAGEDATYPIFRRLARTIVEGMLASGGECDP